MTSVWKLLQDISPITGVPLKNAKNLIGEIFGYRKDIRNRDLFYADEDFTKPSKKYVYDYADLAGAITSGNTKKEAKIKRCFEDNNREIKKTAISKYVKSAYQRY